MKDGISGGVSPKKASWWSRLLGDDEDECVPQRAAATPVASAPESSPTPAENRRATVRVEAPLGQQDTVRFSVRGKPYDAPIHDLSLGGVSFWLPRGEFALLTPGMKLAQATVERGEHRFVADLEVRGTRKVKSFLGGEQLHVGCRFEPLDVDAKAALEAVLAELGGGRPLK
ncbi:MAG: PilZ domain-containing protein [Aromatoleum sp.]|jgi:c-di-GMP-binding flagellar brake protein YcgR|uniref:PilZ domain-containing protein n=1 Tax=Aromatoleum sp. TaxID=2307007 RepID=UPI002895099C|nr:PilZ domain-containing protein [Aromatoleum sp.]MDT3671879.1 PilZ domain-containing protein [Aromatoleum sp.]